MSHKLTNVTISVPYKSSGGVIHQHPVSFDVFKADGHFSLIPCLGEDERRVANLPDELKFTMQDGKPVSLKGKIDGNFHVISDVVALLKKDNQLA